MAQQTALETFWEQIAEILPFSLDSETAIKLYEKYQEAKQKEKEQTEGAKILGHQEGYKRGYLQHALDKTYGTKNR